MVALGPKCWKETVLLGKVVSIINAQVFMKNNKKIESIYWLGWGEGVGGGCFSVFFQHLQKFSLKLSQKTRKKNTTGPAVWLEWSGKIRLNVNIKKQQRHKTNLWRFKWVRIRELNAKFEDSTFIFRVHLKIVINILLLFVFSGWHGQNKTIFFSYFKCSDLLPCSFSWYSFSFFILFPDIHCSGYHWLHLPVLKSPMSSTDHYVVTYGHCLHR